MARLKAPPPDRRVRDALIAEAQRIQDYMDQVDAGRYGRLDDLLSGASVMVRWWELPEPVKAAMPRPDDIGEPWTLDTANTLQPGARG